MAKTFGSRSATDLLARFAQLQLGIVALALGFSLILGADIGLDPWSSLHEALASRSALSFGQVTQVFGIGLIAGTWFFLGVAPGVATVVNTLMLGPWVDVMRPHLVAASWTFELAAPGSVTAMLLCAGQLLAGVAVLAFAMGLYIDARFGAGPRDAFILAFARRRRQSVRRARISIELSLLVVAFALGGPLGLGTLLFALTVGPAMQVSLDFFERRRLRRA